MGVGDGVVVGVGDDVGVGVDVGVAVGIGEAVDVGEGGAVGDGVGVPVTAGVVMAEVVLVVVGPVVLCSVVADPVGDAFAPSSAALHPATTSSAARARIKRRCRWPIQSIFNPMYDKDNSRVVWRGIRAATLAIARERHDWVYAST